MSDPSDHSQTGPRRHRFWAALAVVAVCAAFVALVAGWLTAPPVSVPSSSSQVAVTLPPSNSPQGAAQTPPEISPAAGPPGGTAVAPPPAVAPPSGQIALLPPPAVPGAPPSVAPLNPPSAQSGEQPAWLRYATTAPVDVRDRPRVAIVIDDLGLDRPRTERVIALPAAVTMSFLAYSGELAHFTDEARRNGHEMIVHVPMEPVNAKIDMGPNGLATNQTHDEVLRRLDWDLGRFDGYVGINNHMGSRFTGDAEAMGWVMEDLKSRGLMFLDSRTIGTSIGAKAAAAAGVPFAERDVFLDDDQSAYAVQQRLREVEAIARRKGTAIAIGHPHDATIDALISWIAKLPSKNIVLVPLTDIVKARMGAVG
jgi:polysaccharide deacetylase 2 family uncharacterized protein YibQ